MATRTLRRTVATAALAGFATAFAPMAVSLAAPAAFAASGITTQPAPDGSSVVHANRPVIVATFNATLASGSIKLTAEGGDGTNLCPSTSTSVSGSKVQCQPPADLDKTKTYDAVGSGKDSSGTSAKTSTLKFTVDYPVLDGPNSSPIPNGSFTNGAENITTAFDEPITGQADSSKPDAAFKLYEIAADGNRSNVPLPGTITFNQAPVVGGSDNTITFNPAPNLVNGQYEAVLSVVSEDNSGKAIPTAIGTADYRVFINNSPPFNLNLPVPNYNGKPYANTSNNTAFPFSGNAAPGLTVTVSLTDPMDPSPLSNSYSDSTTVQPCASAPSCPWTVPLDISGFTSPQNNVAWSANATDGNTATGSANGPTFNVDYSAPATVSVNPVPSISPDSKTVTVNASDTDTDVVSYLVKISDPDGNSLSKSFNATNHNLPPSTIDVTTLDDGQLSITIQAVDGVGNVSATGGSQPYHVTKDVGLLPNLGTSVLSSDGGDTTFAEAETQSVQSPTTVRVGFTQPIKESWTDNSNPLQPHVHHSSLCIASQNGNCLFSAAPTVDSNDDHALVMPVKSNVPDGTYTIQVLTYSKGNCDDVAPGGNPNTHTCEQFGPNGAAVVTDPNTGQPFTFTVDSTKPIVTIDSYTHPVTAKNEKSAAFSGTVSKSATTVQLLIKSSGSTTTKVLLNATITPPASSGVPATWAVSGADLSPMPDGTLTIKATAKTSSGLSGTDTVHATMKAHQAVLTEKTNKGKVTFGHAVKVSGLLTDGGGNPISGENVSVKAKYTNGHSGPSINAITDSSGHYSLSIHPKHNGTFYATYGGSPQHDSVTVHTATVGVRYAVTFTSPKQGASASSPVAVTGTVKPNHAGATVTFYRHTSSGNVVVGHAKLNKKSHFSASLSLPAGKDKILAKVKGSKVNLAGASSLLTIHVS